MWRCIVALANPPPPPNCLHQILHTEDAWAKMIYFHKCTPRRACSNMWHARRHRFIYLVLLCTRIICIWLVLARVSLGCVCLWRLLCIVYLVYVPDLRSGDKRPKRIAKHIPSARWCSVSGIFGHAPCTGATLVRNARLPRRSDR